MMGFRFLVGTDDGRTFLAIGGFKMPGDAKRYARELRSLAGRPAVAMVDLHGPNAGDPMLVDYMAPGLAYLVPREGFTIG